MPVNSFSYSPEDLLTQHDRLLFSLVYPASKKQYEIASASLQKLYEYIQEKLKDKNHPFQKTFSNSGISNTVITGTFSFAIAKWLVQEFPDDTEIDSSAADAESIRVCFRAILPRTEFECISTGEYSLATRIRQLKGGTPGTLLSWLIQQMDSTSVADQIKEAFFNSLNVFIKWNISHPYYNRTWIRGTGCVPFIHKSIIKKPGSGHIIAKKLPRPKSLSEKEKLHLVNVARSTLAFLYRETEPFTYADPREITCFELERGLTIVLYGMSKEKRLSIESYIGYLAFKNNIPIAYGGGWIFGQNCQFGINILPAFRGGESLYIFCELLRVYRQFFGAKRFVVKPYQFGKNNKEALASGAFWFYYRAGFRPKDADLIKLASDERKKINKNSQYRTPIAILKKLSTSNLELSFAEKVIPDYDGSLISNRITQYINEQHNGNRDKACAVCEKLTKTQLNIQSLSGWNRFERSALKDWSLIAQVLLHMDNWSAHQKEMFVKLIRAKGNAPERYFIRQLQQHKQFWKDATDSLKQNRNTKQ